MERVFPGRLSKGDEVRIIAPSRSLSIIPTHLRRIADTRLGELGLRISYGKHVEETDVFNSSPVEARIEDLHDAFSDPEVKAVITAIGGYNSNQLLDYIDWSIISKNPKIFCGYSDVTALNNAIFAMTGLVTHSGPHYVSFGQKLYPTYTLDYFRKCLFSNQSFNVEPSAQWSDDQGSEDQEKRNLIPNQGWLVINEGTASGTILGANLCTLNLLQGTQYFPDLSDSILFLEEYENLPAEVFDRNLQSLMQQPGFQGVQGLVMGRFQKGTEMTDEKLIRIIKTKKALSDLPVIAAVDFGHTDPKITFPIGGFCRVNVTKDRQSIQITEH